MCACTYVGGLFLCQFQLLLGIFESLGVFVQFIFSALEFLLQRHQLIFQLGVGRGGQGEGCSRQRDTAGERCRCTEPEAQGQRDRERERQRREREKDTELAISAPSRAPRVPWRRSHRRPGDCPPPCVAPPAPGPARPPTPAAASRSLRCPPRAGGQRRAGAGDRHGPGVRHTYTTHGRRVGWGPSGLGRHRVGVQGSSGN